MLSNCQIVRSTQVSANLVMTGLLSSYIQRWILSRNIGCTTMWILCRNIGCTILCRNIKFRRNIPSSPAPRAAPGPRRGAGASGASRLNNLPSPIVYSIYMQLSSVWWPSEMYQFFLLSWRPVSSSSWAPQLSPSSSFDFLPICTFHQLPSSSSKSEDLNFVSTAMWPQL